MKRLGNFLLGVILGLMLIMVFESANAQESCGTEIVKEETPKEFEGSGIKRKLSDGTVQEFDGNKYKIVPRNQKRKKCSRLVYKEVPPKVIIKYVPVEVIKKVEVVKIKRQRNHLQLFLGNGPSDDLSISNQSGNTARVVSDDENLLGIGYSRDIIDFDDSSLSLGAFYFTNETIGVSAGLSW